MTAICLLMLWVRSGVLEVGVERVVRSASLVLMMGRRDAMRCDGSVGGWALWSGRSSIHPISNRVDVDVDCLGVGWLGLAWIRAQRSRVPPSSVPADERAQVGGRREAGRQGAVSGKRSRLCYVASPYISSLVV